MHGAAELAELLQLSSAAVKRMYLEVLWELMDATASFVAAAYSVVDDDGVASVVIVSFVVAVAYFIAALVNADAVDVIAFYNNNNIVI